MDRHDAEGYNEMTLELRISVPNDLRTVWLVMVLPISNKLNGKKKYCGIGFGYRYSNFEAKVEG